MKKHMIVCDLDGTLLDSEGRVSPRTRAAVQAVQRAGHVFVIATGRPVSDVRPVAEALGHMAIAVCGNGSISYDYAHDRVIDYQPLGHDDVRAALRALRAAVPAARVGSQRELELILEEEFVLAAELCVDARRVRALEDALDERGFGKLIIQSEGDALDYYKTVAELLPSSCDVTVSTADFCEITRADVNKATALEVLAGQFGLSSQCAVAFGDMPNDLPMLAWAGRSIAVANAHPDVLAAVDEVTASHDEDGVACCLEALL